MKSENINELAIALAKAQSQIKSAIKESENPFFKSKYADLTSVWEACREALNKNGLSIVQTLNYETEVAFLETMMLHISGQWISGRCPLINQKGDMQSLGSAISYARRYGLASMVGIVADDDDANTADQKERPDATIPCTPKQAGLIKAKLASAGILGADAAALLNKFGSHIAERIPFIKVNEVLAEIDLKKKVNPKIVPEREEDIPFNPDVAWNKK